MPRPAPPRSEQELLDNAKLITGRKLADIARRLDWPLSPDQRHNKGEIGELIELALGATASSLPEPDFQLIGVELKTIPIQQDGRPTESTYVCRVPMDGATGQQWQDSLVYRKLARVLWVPIQAEREIPLAERRIGSPFLWSPDTGQAQTLQQDWEELMEKICLGEIDQLSARHGVALQIRPKAANRRALAEAIDSEGQRGQTLPRGFYLRSRFTGEILRRHLQH